MVQQELTRRGNDGLVDIDLEVVRREGELAQQRDRTWGYDQANRGRTAFFSLQVRVAGKQTGHVADGAVFRIFHAGEEGRDGRRDFRQGRSTEALAPVAAQQHAFNRLVLQAQLRGGGAAVVAVVVIAQGALHFQVLGHRQHGRRRPVEPPWCPGPAL